MPRDGACAPFADPRLTSAEARPVWVPATGAARLHFTAQPIGEGDGDRLGINISTLPNVEHILLDTAGRTHVIVRSGATFTQFSIGGCDALTGPVALGLNLCRREEIGAVGKKLTGLQSALCGPPSVASAPPSWTGHTRRLRDALVALDCQRADAKLREIAIVIYGRVRVEREWPGNGLRKRLSRDMERGRALSNGGYRRLLL